MSTTTAAITGNSPMNSPSRSSDDIIDTTPLLSQGNGGSYEETTSNVNSNSRRPPIRRQGLQEAARFLRRATNRRLMREPSMMVRETATEQLEERQSDWAYSKPVVVLDVIWNLAFVAVAVSILFLSRYENPDMPLRLWIVGYGLQCLLHMVCVVIEFRRRRRRQMMLSSGFSVADDGNGSSGNSSSGSRRGSQQYVTLAQFEEEGTSVAKHLESANTMFSFIWWIIGFYWVSAGGQALARESPQLYWLCIIFLGFDVFFVVFCVALACVIGIAVCCCLPCIIAILYAVADQEGASKEDIDMLSKYKFRRLGDDEKLTGDGRGTIGGIMTECGTDAPFERTLSPEDAECCICLSAYDDGVELRELPCRHHFHCACVDKWLYLNATCPLCKYNILKSTSQDREEV
ncbi:E3 ubiquitin-protein ligase [Tripterygium wilfordii]|uniref:RING-type E3 ubiquitin transferase n=1 Tax=Tripterygium wilfordii TaxID=458696 RepID=A0A7J7CL91_TRIWF|nr:E3 ubiquitin-protein ligase At1g12760-like isoform X2 [Tripterygium wilfordii]KAF5734832.1 E3 ubiquitin-protein ligase [Tripterygium wilfordii]